MIHESPISAHKDKYCTQLVKKKSLHYTPAASAITNAKMPGTFVFSAPRHSKWFWVRHYASLDAAQEESLANSA